MASGHRTFAKSEDGGGDHDGLKSEPRSPPLTWAAGPAGQPRPKSPSPARGSQPYQPPARDPRAPAPRRGRQAGQQLSAAKSQVADVANRAKEYAPDLPEVPPEVPSGAASPLQAAGRAAEAPPSAGQSQPAPPQQQQQQQAPARGRSQRASSKRPDPKPVFRVRAALSPAQRTMRRCRHLTPWVLWSKAGTAASCMPTSTACYVSWP